LGVSYFCKEVIEYFFDGVFGRLEYWNDEKLEDLIKGKLTISSFQYFNIPSYISNPFTIFVP
jgi:hypothetical protein